MRAPLLLSLAAVALPLSAQTPSAPAQGAKRTIELTGLVLVNGFFIPPAERATRALNEGDELAIWPPIAGG